MDKGEKSSCNLNGGRDVSGLLNSSPTYLYMACVLQTPTCQFDRLTHWSWTVHNKSDIPARHVRNELGIMRTVRPTVLARWIRLQPGLTCRWSQTRSSEVATIGISPVRHQRSAMSSAGAVLEGGVVYCYT